MTLVFSNTTLTKPEARHFPRHFRSPRCLSNCSVCTIAGRHCVVVIVTAHNNALARASLTPAGLYKHPLLHYRELTLYKTKEKKTDAYCNILNLLVRLQT